MGLFIKLPVRKPHVPNGARSREPTQKNAALGQFPLGGVSQLMNGPSTKMVLHLTLASRPNDASATGNGHLFTRVQKR